MEVPLGDTYTFCFTTRAFSSGIPTTLAGTPSLSVKEEGNDTIITAGVSVDVDTGATPVTGLHEATVVATTGNGYAVGQYYSVFIDTGTVDSVSVVGEVVGHFRVMAAEGVAGEKEANVASIGDTAVPASAGVLQVNATQIEGSDATNQINAAVDAALDTAIPGSPTVDSINERLASLDDLLQSGGAGDAAAILTDTSTGVALAVDSVDSASLATTAANEIRDAIAAIIVEDAGPGASNVALDDAIAIILAYCAGQATGQDTTSPIFKSPDGVENRIVATTDGSGNRSAIAFTLPS